MSKVQSTFLIAGLAVATLMTVSAAGAAPHPIPIQAHANSLSVSPMPGFTHGTFTVRLRGAGIVYEEAFEPQQGFNYGLLTDAGGLLGDGRYVFEVWVAGSASGTQKLSGSFEILGGTVSTETLEVDVKQDIIDVTILGDAIVEGALCVSDSTDCIFDLILFESESFDTPGFGAADIKVKDNVPEIWFADTSAEDGDFALTVEDSKFFLRDPDADTLPLTVESGAPTDSVYVTATGRVGFNTSVPGAQVHVVSSVAGGNATIVDNGALQVRRLDGTNTNIRFTSDERNWLFANAASNSTPSIQGTFQIRDETAGQTPVIVYPASGVEILTIRNGRVGIDNNNPAHPLDTGTGAFLSVGGAWTNASSRELKTGLAPVNTQTMLERLIELPVHTWRYRSEAPAALHVGPVAEDFELAFGLGDGKTIATVDADGVLIAAVQGLNDKVERQRGELLSKNEEIEALKARLNLLEERLSRTLP